MTRENIYTFIDHWHAAARETISPIEESISIDEELRKHVISLRCVIRDSRSVRNLATNPLLCALLCALHLERRTNLPKRRMELYRIALAMLLERRDVDRAIGIDDAVTLSRVEKELLLQDLAYWFLINNQSDADTSGVLARLAKQLKMLPSIDQNPKAVLRHLLERSGILREPSAGRIDFIHLTFQEYLAAKAIVDEDSIGQLVDNAHRDQWNEVLILAAGHARADQWEKLATGLLKRGAKETHLRHKLHLLAVACQETATRITPRLRRTLEKGLKDLFPPKSVTEARALASAGKISLSFLSGHADRSSEK
jgi:predicted NACHT family NTPase